MDWNDREYSRCDVSTSSFSLFSCFLSTFSVRRILDMRAWLLSSISPNSYFEVPLSPGCAGATRGGAGKHIAFFTIHRAIFVIHRAVFALNAGVQQLLHLNVHLASPLHRVQYFWRPADEIICTRWHCNEHEHLHASCMHCATHVQRPTNLLLVVCVMSINSCTHHACIIPLTSDNLPISSWWSPSAE